MKNYYYLIVLLFSNIINSQENIATYSMSCNIDQTELKNKDELINFVDLNSEDISFNLYFTKSNSIFYLNDKIKEPENKISLTSIKAEIIGVFFINNEIGKYYNQISTYGNKFIVEDSIKKIKWEFVNVKKKVDNFVCYKAQYSSKVYLDDGEGGKIEKNKTVEVWYAPEIPFSTGPLGYSGLPGLIIELHDDIFTYTLKSLNLNIKKSNKINMPTDGKLLSRKEYDTIYLELKNKRNQQLKDE